MRQPQGGFLNSFCFQVFFLKQPAGRSRSFFEFFEEDSPHEVSGQAYLNRTFKCVHPRLYSTEPVSSLNDFGVGQNFHQQSQQHPRNLFLILPNSLHHFR